MQAGHGQRAAGLDLAGDSGVVERAFGLQGDQAGLGVGLVAVLDRRLHRAQRGGVHGKYLSDCWSGSNIDDGGRTTEDRKNKSNAPARLVACHPSPVIRRSITTTFLPLRLPSAPPRRSMARG